MLNVQKQINVTQLNHLELVYASELSKFNEFFLFQCRVIMLTRESISKGVLDITFKLLESRVIIP